MSPSHCPAIKALRRVASLAVFLCTLALLLSCSKTPAGLPSIVGKWRDEDGAQFEFKTDGTIAATEDGDKATGKYHFVDATHLKMELAMLHKPGADGKSATDTMSADCTFKSLNADAFDLIMTVTMSGKPGGNETAHFTRNK